MHDQELSCSLPVDFTDQESRVEVDYNGSSAIVPPFERYPLYLKGLVFPGEVMSHQAPSSK